MALPGATEARSSLVRGAAAKPKAFRIRHPFPCGVPLRVNCAYGPDCSPAHRRVDNDSGPNDYYAIDFIRAEEGSGQGKAVVAVAAGVVRYAGWTRGGWSPYGKVVYLEQAYRDGAGHRYQTLYAHLDSVRVRKGQTVRAGQVIGTLGGSSKRRRAYYGPHLHFAMYQDAKRTLGGGRAVLPEPLGNFRDLHRGMRMVSCGRPEPRRVASLPPGTALSFGGWYEDDSEEQAALLQLRPKNPLVSPAAGLPVSLQLLP